MKRVLLLLVLLALPRHALADPPTAEAGPDKDAEVGSTVTLDGSGSSDPDGDDLTFEWQVVSSPSGASASVSGAGSESASLSPDVAGEWRIELLVDDGTAIDADEMIVVAYDPGDPPPDPGAGNGDPNGGAFAHRGACEVAPGSPSGVITLVLAGLLLVRKRRSAR